MNKSILILLLLLSFPSTCMRSNEMLEHAREMNRRSRELREIDEIIEMQNEIRYASRSRSRPRIDKCLSKGQIANIATGVIGLATGILGLIQFIVRK